jgi:hypothetical protein
VRWLLTLHDGLHFLVCCFKRFLCDKKSSMYSFLIVPPRVCSDVEDTQNRTPATTSLTV